MKQVLPRLFAVLILSLCLTDVYGQLRTRPSSSQITTQLDDPDAWENATSLPDFTNLTDDLEIYGYYTIGNLFFQDGGLDGALPTTVTIYDTLVIESNLETGRYDQIIIAPDGLLIVLGDVNNGVLSTVVNSGTVIIRGSITSDEIAYFGVVSFYENVGDLYIYDQNPDVNIPTGGEYNLAKGPDDLQAENPDAYNFTSTEAAAPLPVKVTSFYASNEDNKVKLSWTTSSEINFDYFEIQRLTADGKFEVIGTLAGNGNSSKRIDYQFVDRQPLNGDNQYQLVAVDLDGSRESHGLVSAYVMSQEKILLAPNRVTNHAFRVFSPSTGKEGFLQLYTDGGLKVFEQKIHAGTQLITLPYDLSAGVYLVKVMHGNHQYMDRLLIVN